MLPLVRAFARVLAVEGPKHPAPIEVDYWTPAGKRMWELSHGQRGHS